MKQPHLLVCPGAHHQLEDQSGNKTTAGLLALGRLTRGRMVGPEGALWLAVFDALTWGEQLYNSLECCQKPCTDCPAAKAAEGLKGGTP